MPTPMIKNLTHVGQASLHSHTLQAPIVATGHNRPQAQPHGHALRRLVLAALLLGTAGSGWAASQSFTAVARGAVDGSLNDVFDRFNPNGALNTGGNFRTGQLEIEHRWAMEFNVSSLPAGAVVQSASLRLRSDLGTQAGQTLISGYLGDGTITFADMRGGTPVLTFTPVDAQGHAYNVTGFVRGALGSAASWIGFNLRQSPVVSQFGGWDNPTESSPPLLTIQYSMSAVPEPQTCLMLLLGMGVMVGAARQRRVA